MGGVETTESVFWKLTRVPEVVKTLVVPERDSPATRSGANLPRGPAVRKAPKTA